MEILILIFGLVVFSESFTDKPATNNVSALALKQQYLPRLDTVKDFEMINKGGVWVFAPIQKNTKATVLNENNTGQTEFITLPDGSKIEKGF